MLLRSPLSSLSILITSVLSYASDRFLIYISSSSFCGILICSFIWAMFLCLFILAASLCLFLCIRQSCFDSVLVTCPNVEKCTNKLDGAEPQVITRVGQPMRTRLMESPICCGHSAVLCRGGFRKGTIATAWPLEFCPRGSSPRHSPWCRHFNFSPYTTGTLPAASLMLEPTESESEEVPRPLQAL